MESAVSHRTRCAAWLRGVLAASVGHRYYPLVVALLAFILTVTFAFPFTFVLIPAVLLAPRRWLIVGALSGIGSGLGAALLVEIFHYLGREVVLVRYPQVLASGGWQQIESWLADYGLWAIAVIAGGPLPQTPALFLYSLGQISTPGVLVAVGLGKTVKYVALAWLTARYPARFIRYR